MGDTPKLAQFIGDGARQEGFEELVKFTASLKDLTPETDPNVQRLVRFATAVSIACVEIAAQEHERDPDALVDILHALCTGTAVAMTSAALSVLRDDTPAEVLRELVMTSFQSGLEQTIKSNGLV
jgi:hypothetical protein